MEGKILEKKHYLKEIIDGGEHTTYNPNSSSTD
jgi:hypothetical protein